MKKLIVIAIFLFIITVSPALATLGVGVGVGKIQVDENLKPGVIYQLPSITVLNTGDEPSNYEMAIMHHEGQKELIPEENWFTFTPQTFNLTPGKVQEVKISLSLPVRTDPGDYFAYLEARPTKKTAVGTTAVNIAAATKLYFTVVPGSFLEGIYYKLVSLWNMYAPVPQIIVAVILILASLLIIKRFIKIEIQLSKKGVPKWLLAIVAIVLLGLYTLFWLKYLGAI